MIKRGIMAKKKKQSMKPFPIILLALLVIGGIVYFVSTGSNSKVDAASLAQCMTEKGLKMYGSITCSVCAREKQIFKDDFQYVNYIECNPRGENPQTELCLQKDISDTPTWILEDSQGNDIKRYVGFMSFQDLADFTGCQLQEKNG